ncbi:hypothetical protein AOQ84DRAFT_429109 [Glonium stellatum]|uniref:DNA polymerase V n=1 Tax=Glonium stellatum TaxID=574774 RepID=A0A8E2FBA7_9PEZI|nr:hypothetical protein AOQ84DRAFT_429109 [Glonium stellatum]
MKAAKDLIMRFSPKSIPSAEIVQKALVRLVRGLCSSRKAARFGFFVALTEILRQLYSSGGEAASHSELSIDGVIDLVTERTQPEGRVVGQEKRDHLIGRVFGYKAIMQSSILIQQDASLECWTKVLDHVYKLARDIPWLREECGLILCDAIKSLDPKGTPKSYVREIVQRLSSYNIAKTPEGIAIWLTILSVFSEDVLPDDIWRKKDPLCTKERRVLANVMRENFTNVSDNEDSGKMIKSGSAHSNPSFAWDVVLATIMERTGNRKGGLQHAEQSDFSKFWVDVVDDNLFSGSASLERKSWGFQLFSRMVATAPQWAIPALFSPNLIRSLINHRTSAERFLHNATLAPLKEILARVQNQPEIASSIVPALTSKNGAIKFDQLTKTKTLESILLAADDTTLRKIIAHFHLLILRPEVQEQDTASTYRRILADILLNLVRGYKRYQLNTSDLTSDESWLRQLLDILVECAYFVPNHSAPPDAVPLPAISTSSRTIFRDRLSSCLTHLVSTRQPEQILFPYLVVSIIQAHTKASRSQELVFDADKAVTKAVKKAHKVLERLGFEKRSSNEAQKTTNDAFILLYSLTILQVYNGDTDAASILYELDICHQSISEKQDSAGSESFDLLLEVLLSFLAKPSALFRKLAGQVFALFTADVTSNGLQSLIEILEKGESLAGQHDLFDQDIDEAENDMSDDDLEIGSDIEMIQGPLAGSAENSDEVSEGEQNSSASSNASSQESEDSSDEEKDDEELAKFDAMLADTLKMSRLGGDTVLSESSDDEDMDDGQMMALEPHLTKIFQERKKTTSKKREKKDARENVINFKNRVLDLLLIYAKKQHANALTLQLILPILRLIRVSTSKQISEKSFNLLKEYFDTCKGKELPIPDEEEKIWVMLEQIHAEARLDGSKLHGNACSRSSLFVVKVLVALNEDNYGRAVDVYSETQKQWYQDAKSKIQPALFTEWINWSINTRKQKK